MSKLLVPNSPNLTGTQLAEVLRPAMKALADFNASGSESMRVLQQFFLAEILTRCSGNKCRAARRLVVHRNTFGRQVEQLHLQPFIDRLRETMESEPRLFNTPIRKIPRPVGFAQDVLVINGNPQCKKGAYPQFTHKVASGSA